MLGVRGGGETLAQGPVDVVLSKGVSVHCSRLPTPALPPLLISPIPPACTPFHDKPAISLHCRSQGRKERLPREEGREQGGFP